jgi:hypothetical protein
MTSNLPPGCSSPDGGIDHAAEAATEELLQTVENVPTLQLLTALAPILEKWLDNAYAAGFADGRMEAQQEFQETDPDEWSLE